VALEALPMTLESPSTAQVEWNIEFVKAPAVWKKGFKGKGIIIGNSDTGVKWDVAALKPSYLGGNNGSHNFHWFDPSPSPSKVPIDTHGHGTHCMGTKVGLDGQNIIGMAPESKWLACRSLGPGASRNSVLKCLEFFLAPFDVNGKNPNPTKRPHVTSHSYLCNGCNLGPAIRNLKAAGIAVVVANGNSGPRCKSVTHPADLEESFSVGALAEKSNNIAAFSSRGSNAAGDVKPDISAPGANVRSCTPSGYQMFSGTSMAAPAVAGCYALLWNAVPKLSRQLDKSEEILRNSALQQRSNGQCDSDGAPNNVFGYGTINIEKAIAAAEEMYGYTKNDI